MIVTTYTHDRPGSVLHGTKVRVITPADIPPQLPASARNVAVSPLGEPAATPEYKSACCSALIGTQNNQIVCRACGSAINLR